MGSPRVQGCEAEQLWEGTLSISVPQFPQGELYVGRRRGEVAFIGALPTTVLHKHFLYPHSQLQAALGRRLMGDGVPCWGRSGGTGSAGSTVPAVLGGLLPGLCSQHRHCSPFSFPARRDGAAGPGWAHLQGPVGRSAACPRREGGYSWGMGCGVILLTPNLQWGDPNSCSPSLVSPPGSLRDKPKLSPRHWGAQDTNLLPTRPHSALSPLSQPGMALGTSGWGGHQGVLQQRGVMGGLVPTAWRGGMGDWGVGQKGKVKTCMEQDGSWTQCPPWPQSQGLQVGSLTPVLPPRHTEAAGAAPNVIPRPPAPPLAITGQRRKPHSREQRGNPV